MGSRSRFLWVISPILAGSLLFGPRPVLAQDPAEPPAGPPAGLTGDDPAATDEQQAIFGIQIEEVTIPVTVTDSKGEFITDLNPGDFRLRDNGKEQHIEGFEMSWEPISMVIVVETSSRVENELPKIAKYGILFTQLVMGESGEAAVIGFDREINLLQDFTTNADSVEAALKNLKAGADDVRLSDAMARAMALLQRRNQDRRKVIVVLSEARDSGSSNTPGFVLRNAQQLGISIYPITLSTVKNLFNRAAGTPGGNNPFPPGVVARPQPANEPPTPQAQARYSPANINVLPLIEELVAYTKNLLGANPLPFFAVGTGAQEFNDTSQEDVEQALSKIGSELRNQYLLTYRPNNLEEPSFHHIVVQVDRPGAEVRTRPGYMFTHENRRVSPSRP